MPVALPLRGGNAAVKVGRASLASSISNLSNTIIGTGMLATPGAFKYTGLLPGCMLIVLCGATSIAGLLLLNLCARRVGGRENSFFSLAKLTIPRGARWFDAAIALKCYGVSISYLIINGQLMPQVVLSFARALGHEPHAVPHWLLDRNVWILLFMVVLIPLCFLRRLDSLRHTSYLSLVSVAYLVLVVIMYSLPSHAATLPKPGEVHLIHLDGSHFISIFPVFVFAFTCAQNNLPMYNELRATSTEHFALARRAVVSAVSLAGTVYLIIGILGYLTFGDKVGSNIIAMYPNELFVCFARIAIVVLVAFSYPLQVHPCRAALDKVLFGSSASHAPTPVPTRDTNEDEEEEDTSGPEEGRTTLLNVPHQVAETPYEMPLARWCALTAFILSTTFVVALLIDDLGLILGFVGSVGSTTISFILPGILYASLHKDQPANRLRRPAIGLAVYGAIVLCLSLTANTLKLYHHGTANSKADRVAALVAEAVSTGNGRRR